MTKSMSNCIVKILPNLMLWEIGLQNDIMAYLTVTKGELFHHVNATKSYLDFERFTGDVILCSKYIFF